MSATIVCLKRSEAVDLLVGAGYKSAGRKDNAFLAGKIRSLPKIIQDDGIDSITGEMTEAQKKRLQNLLDEMGSDADIEIEDDGHEANGHSPAPKGKGKKAKAKASKATKATAKASGKAPKAKASAKKSKREGPSCLDAIVKCMSKTKAVQMGPLWEMVKKVWKSPGGKTPENTMRSTVYNHVKQHGNKSLFKKVDGGWVLR